WEETKTNAVIIGAPVTLAAPTPTVAANAAAPEQVGKNALVLTGAQLLEALDFIAPDRATDPEQMEATVAIEFGHGHGGEATYIWCAEYPEEGSFVLDGTSTTVEPAAAQLDERAALTYPEELSDDLREVLGWPNFRCGPVAHVMRDSGDEIKRKAEDEQAHVLHWLVKLVLKHGADWQPHAAEALKEIRSRAASQGAKQ
ncbi:hypothetical protein, partial [Paraburkholderia unamae]